MQNDDIVIDVGSHIRCLAKHLYSHIIICSGITLLGYETIPLQLIQANLRYLARRFRKSFETITACRRLYGVELINLFRKRLLRKIDLIDVHIPAYSLHVRGGASSLVMFARASSSLFRSGVEVVVGGIEEYFKINPLSLESLFASIT